MKNLVRRLLVHYDRYGVVAALEWLVASTSVIALAFLAVNAFFLHMVHVKPRLSGLPTAFLISPVVIYIVPTLWASGFLIIERMWMFVGIHAANGWEPYKIRKLIGRLAGEQR
jgi:hypothetical protein